MNNYLLQLLKEVKTLIIPGLGALTVTNETTGEIMFMPYLKYDDGTLAQHIANKEGMDINDAKNLIAKFVREVTIALDKGESYDMYEFGSFKKIEGEVAFEKWGSSSEKPMSTPDSSTIISEPIEEPPIETVQEIIEPVVAEKEPTKEIITEEETVTINQEAEKSPEPIDSIEIEPIVTAPVEVETSLEIAPEEISHQTQPSTIQKDIPVEITETVKKEDKKVEKTTKAEKPKAATKEKGPKKKVSMLSYILWGVFVLIIGSGTYIFINYDHLKYDFPILADLAGEQLKPVVEDSSTTILQDEPEMNIDSNTASEPLPEEEIEGLDETTSSVPETTAENTSSSKPTSSKKEVPVSKPVVKPVKKITPAPKADGSLPFHVIAGSFGSEANANRLANSLQSKGYHAASVMQNNGMFRVSVKGFSTLAEATNEAKNMQGDVPGAWVLKK